MMVDVCGILFWSIKLTQSVILRLIIQQWTTPTHLFLLFYSSKCQTFKVQRPHAQTRCMRDHTYSWAFPSEFLLFDSTDRLILVTTDLLTSPSKTLFINISSFLLIKVDWSVIDLWFVIIKSIFWSVARLKMAQAAHWILSHRGPLTFESVPFWRIVRFVHGSTSLQALYQCGGGCYHLSPPPPLLSSACIMFTHRFVRHGELYERHTQPSMTSQSTIC